MRQGDHTEHFAVRSLRYACSTHACTARSGRRFVRGISGDYPWGAKAMRTRTFTCMIGGVLCWSLSALTGTANATPLVTFYNDQSSFLAAVSSPTVHNF